MIACHLPLQVLQSPSSKYQPASLPRLLVANATSPANPTLPRRKSAVPPCSRALVKPPMESTLRGQGRGGKYGELREVTGAVYRGDVLAGRPHGQGQYLVPGRYAGSTLLSYCVVGMVNTPATSMRSVLQPREATQ